ncbi:MAG: enoyl-CoA hydratase/isomerase family protein [Actinomycetes bacterium]
MELSEAGVPQGALVFLDVSQVDADDAHRVAALVAAGTLPIIGISDREPAAQAMPLLEALTFTVVAAGDELPPTCVHVPSVEDAVAALATSAEQAPLAALTLCELLRTTASLPVPDALVAESLAYSMLLGSAEFARWLPGRERRPGRTPAGPPVLVSRDGTTLNVRLNQPERRNAFDRSLRDALVEALEIAVYDETVAQVLVSGRGPAFCSGGDLDEFGTTPDVATAHVIRTTRSPARLINQLRGRTHVVVHGACVGAGVELAAFAGSVSARPDASFWLPELSMGLIPGAGGTVSLPRRIGRWRTAWLALTGTRIDAETAMIWGLVDARANG